MKDWLFATMRRWMVFGVLWGSIFAHASAPEAVWDGNFKDVDSNNKVVLENGCSLSINGNEVAKDGATITIGEDAGVYIDWVNSRTTVTVLFHCSDLPAVSGNSAIVSLWDKSSNSDLVGVALGSDGRAVGIWEKAIWTGNVWSGAEIGTNVVGLSPNGVFAMRYDGGLGYHGNTVGGTALFFVNLDDDTITEVYFDVNLKRASAQFSGITIGACKNSTSIAPLKGLEIYGVAVYGDYLSEDEIVEASKNFVSESTSTSRVAKPQIFPTDTVFDNTFQEVSMICDTEGATIYYTTDGREPNVVDGLEYTRPFRVYKTCEIKAVAVKDDRRDSVTSTSVITRSECLSEATSFFGYVMETDELHPWTVATDISRDGISSVRSGAIGNNGTTWLQTSIKKAGAVSFWWKSACEEADEEEGEDGYYDYGAFLIDDVVVARIAGHDGEWHYVSHEVNSGGKHTLKWEYRKDGVTSYAPDCIWVDQVQWVPADGSGYTLTTPEPVPYSWLTEYGLGAGTDFETAASVLSGKMQSGKATRIWEEFVAGTDPTNEASVLTATIEVRDGAPVVTWDPDLNESGTKSERLYKIYGKENLTDSSWAYPTNSLHRFFKVTVEMP